MLDAGATEITHQGKTIKVSRVWLEKRLAHYQRLNLAAGKRRPYSVAGFYEY